MTAPAQTGVSDLAERVEPQQLLWSQHRGRLYNSIAPIDRGTVQTLFDRIKELEAENKALKERSKDFTI